jgi:hypothetical protein
MLSFGSARVMSIYAFDGIVNHFKSTVINERVEILPCRTPTSLTETTIGHCMDQLLVPLYINNGFSLVHYSRVSHMAIIYDPSMEVQRLYGLRDQLEKYIASCVDGISRGTSRVVRLPRTKFSAVSKC